MAEKIYRVNMSNLSYKIEEVPSHWMGLGGRALTSTVISEEVDPECHPLGPNNKMVFAPVYYQVQLPLTVEGIHWELKVHLQVG